MNIDNMTIEQIRTALDFLERSFEIACDAKDFSLAEALYSRIHPMHVRLIRLNDEQRDWGMEWYDTSMELA